MSVAPVLTAAGRHAIALVAREARADGFCEVLVPQVACATMLVPFDLEGMRVVPVACGPDGLLDASSLVTALARCVRPPVVLHAETFGNVAGPDLHGALAGARAAGSRVVVDATHSLLRHVVTGGPAPVDGADRVVASLRKLLPVGLGGVVVGLAVEPELAWDELDDDLVAVAHAVADFPAIGSLHDGLEDLLDLAWTPAALPEPLADMLRGLDLAEVAAERQERLVRVHAALAHLDVVNAGAPYFPVVRHSRADALRQALADAGLPVPLHWPGCTDDLVVVPDDPRAVRVVLPRA